MRISTFRAEEERPQPRRSLTAFFLLVVMFGPLPGMAQSARIFFGDPSHPVVAGEAWLIANCWGNYPSVLVATIRNGKLEARESLQFPEFWDQPSIISFYSPLPIDPWSRPRRGSRILAMGQSRCQSI